MGALVGMTGRLTEGIDLWGATWMALALVLTGASVVCGFAAWRRPRHLARAVTAVTAVTAAVVMVISTLDMALPGRLLPPLVWAAVLLALMLVGLPGMRFDAGTGARTTAAQHAAGLLFMAVMWLAMLPTAPISAATADAAAPASLPAAHAHAAGSLLLPLGWVLIAASVMVVVLVVRATRRQAGQPGGRHRWAAAQHASMGLSMSAMTLGMIVPLMFG